MATTVQANAEQSRFEVSVDGELAGFAEYHLHDEVAAFSHTEIKPEFGGQGLAKMLVSEALDEARERGWSVEPFCGFVRGFIQKNPEYADLVATESRERFGL